MNGLTMRLRKKLKNYLEINENEHTTTPNLWVTAKEVQGEKFISLQDYLKNQEKSQKKKNLTLHLHLKELQKIMNKKAQNQYRRKEIINIRAETNDPVTKKPITKDQ